VVAGLDGFGQKTVNTMRQFTTDAAVSWRTLVKEKMMIRKGWEARGKPVR